MNASPAVDGRTLLRVLGVKERMEAYREAVSLQIEQVSADLFSRVLYKLYCCSDVLQIVGRGLATHAEILRETVAADYVRESYEEASNNEAKGLVAAYARPAQATHASDWGQGWSPGGFGCSRSTGNAFQASPPALGYRCRRRRETDSQQLTQICLVSADQRLRLTRCRLLKPASDAASVSSESEAAAIESAIRCLNRLAAENDTLRGKLLSIETTLHEQVRVVWTHTP